MADPLITGGAGAGGTVIGAVLTFFGFKSKLQDIDKRIDRLADNVMFKDTCNANHKAIADSLDIQSKLMTETREDIKSILEKI